MRDAGGRRAVENCPYVPPALKRLLNVAAVVCALAVSVLVARHFAREGWPIHHANPWLVALAALMFVAAYAAKAWGWQRLFHRDQQPAMLTLAASAGAASVKDTMEKQMRADREKRAAILQAEGVKQSQILTAEGEKQAAILRAEGEKQSAILAAQGQSEAITTVFKAIHDGNPDPQLLAYQYLQVLPQIAQGEANKMWIIPSDLQQAVGRVAGAIKDLAPAPSQVTDGQKPE